MLQEHQSPTLSNLPNGKASLDGATTANQSYESFS